MTFKFEPTREEMAKAHKKYKELLPTLGAAADNLECL
jgi:hypothetical protein